MNSISDIINKYHSQLNKSNFDGDIYFPDNNGKLQIERSVFNKMLNKFNEQFEEPLFSPNDDEYCLSFKYEVYEKSESLWREDRNYYMATILTNRGIVSVWSEETTGFEKKPDQIDILLWEEIEDIKWYYDDEKNNFFRFFIKNETHQYDLYLNRFGFPKYDNGIQQLLTLLTDIVIFENNKEQAIEQHFENLYSKIENLGFQEKIDKIEALDILEEFKADYVNLNEDNSNSRFYYIHKIKFTEDPKQALRVFSDYKKLCGDKLGPATTFEIAKVYAMSHDYLSAVNYFAHSEENYNDAENKQEVQVFKKNAYSQLIKEFTSIDYDNRKLVFVADEVVHTSMDGMVVLKKNSLPQGIQFPMNHPKINEVYVCHPINKNAYLPIKEFEKELFTDRLHELMLLLGSLGAKKIDISSQERNVNTENQKNNMQANASLDAKINSARGDYEKNSSEDGSLEHELNVKFHQIFNPKKTPFIPNNLVWYHSNLGWQRLANQRLNGNLLIHTEVISTKQVETLSTNEIKKLNAEITFLWGKAKAGGSYTNEIDFKSVTERNYTLEIAVEFEDIDNLQQVVSNENTVGIENKTTSNESYQQYAEEICFMLEDDGEIDEKERRVLERLRKNLGLSEEEAKQIEEEITQLSQNEKEYLEEYQAIIADGEITERERRLLNRLSSSLGISEERIKELEK